MFPQLGPKKSCHQSLVEPELSPSTVSPGFCWRSSVLMFAASLFFAKALLPWGPQHNPALNPLLLLFTG